MPSPSPDGAGRAVRPGAVEWLFGAVGLALVVQYRWILDDSTIYYRYVDNLLFLHRGLVFNAGEFVEGYSSPLWALLLIGLRATHLDYWSITLLVAVVAYALFWYAAVVANRRLVGDADAGLPVNVPLVFLSTSYAATSYFTSGSESPLMQLSAAAIALYAIDPRWRWLEVALGALPLVRNEMVVPLVAVAAVGWLATRRVPWVLLGTAGALGLGWLAFRVGYYADFFPTPFYLKDKVSPGQGFYYVWNAVWPGHFLLVALPLLAALAHLKRRGEGRLMLAERGRMGVVVLASLPYVIKVGGDMMHHRLLAMPVCLSALALGGVAERWLRSTAFLRTARVRVASALALGAVLVAAYPSFLSSHPLGRHEGRELMHGISDAPWHRQHERLTFDGPRWSEDRARLAAYRSASSDHTGVGTDVLCAAMFDDFRKRYVHGYGLTEPVLARIDVPEERPGHKPALVRLARDLVALRSRDPDTAPGVAARAVAEGRAPTWLAANEAKVRQVEERMYNRHRFFDNLAIALHRIGAIVVPPPAAVSVTRGP